MRTCHAFLTAVLLLAATAGAIDLPTEAMVTIVEGIEMQQTSPLDFGILARSNGTVTVSAVDGSYLDPGAIVFNNATISQGTFTVDSVAGAVVELACTPGAMPGGLGLHSFTVEWATLGSEDPVPGPHTLTAASQIMKLGASLTVTAADMPVPLGAVELPYTVTLTFQ